MEDMGLIDFYKDKRVLITGHTGFKGTWLTKILLSAGAEVTGYSLDPPTQPSLFELADLNGLHDVKGDVRDLDHLMEVLDKVKPEIVFHLAAQPIVRESYRNPVYTYEANVMGTVNVLECIRQTSSVRSAVIITTDKVYKNNEWLWGYREDEPLDGYDPYSNSKSCADLAVHSYVHSYPDLPAISVARAGNVIGGGDFAKDRIIPDCVRAVEKDEKITVRNPYSTRPYQHVLEPLSAYMMIARAQWDDRKYAGCYNVGPDDSDCLTTGELVTLFCDKWNKTNEGLPKAEWISKADADAPHEASFLKLDSTKIKTLIGFRPVWHIDECMKKTVEFSKVYLTDKKKIPEEMDKEIEEYFCNVR